MTQTTRATCDACGGESEQKTEADEPYPLPPIGWGIVTTSVERKRTRNSHPPPIRASYDFCPTCMIRVIASIRSAAKAKP